MPKRYPLKSWWKIIIKIFLRYSIPLILIVLFIGIDDSFSRIILFLIIFGILVYFINEINNLYNSYIELYHKKSVVENDLKHLLKFSSKNPWGFKFLNENVYKIKNLKMGAFIFKKVMNCADLDSLKHNLNEMGFFREYK